MMTVERLGPQTRAFRARVTPEQNGEKQENKTLERIQRRKRILNKTEGNNKPRKSDQKFSADYRIQIS